MSARFQYAVLSLIALIGMIIVLLGHFAGSVETTNIMDSIGTSIIATAIVSFVIRIWLGDPTEATINGVRTAQIRLEHVLVESAHVFERASKTGLLSAWTARQELTTEAWIIKLRAANRQIKLLAYAMAFLPDHPEFVQILEEKMKNGCPVLINLGQPESPCVVARETEEDEDITPRIYTAINRMRHLIGRPNFRLRVHNHPIYCSVFLFDDELFVTPHLFGIRGAGAPLFHFRNIPGGIFGKYEGHFDRLWAQSTEINRVTDLAVFSPSQSRQSD